MPVTSFVVTGTALRAAPGRPFPLPSKTFSSDLHAGPRLRMKDRQTRGARSVPDRAPLVWTSFEQGAKASCSPPAPWAAAPRLPQVDDMVHSGGNTACPVPHPANAKAPGRCDRALFMPEQDQSCLPPPCSPGDWPSFFRLWRYATCRGPEQKFWEGRGEHEGRGRTLFQKGLPLPSANVFFNHPA